MKIASWRRSIILAYLFYRANLQHLLIVFMVRDWSITNQCNLTRIESLSIFWM